MRPVADGRDHRARTPLSFDGERVGDCSDRAIGDYPNFMLNILPGRLQTNIVIPVGADRCRVIFQYYYEDTESIEGQELIARDIEYSDEIQKEDIDICERVQVGLSSRAYDRGRLSPEAEQGVYHFQTLLRESCREWRSRAIAGSDALV